MQHKSLVPTTKKFTAVLDTVYNLGDPKNEGFSIKDEYKGAYDYYYKLMDKFNGNFDRVVTFGLMTELVDQHSGFWQDYAGDIVYKGLN